MQAAGHATAWPPYAEFIHHDSVSRRQEDSPEKQARFERECACMYATWNTHAFNDPAYDVNRSLDSDDFAFADAT